MFDQDQHLGPQPRPSHQAITSGQMQGWMLSQLHQKYAQVQTSALQISKATHNMASNFPTPTFFLTLWLQDEVGFSPKSWRWPRSSQPFKKKKRGSVTASRQDVSSVTPKTPSRNEHKIPKNKSSCHVKPMPQTYWWQHCTHQASPLKKRLSSKEIAR